MKQPAALLTDLVPSNEEVDKAVEDIMEDVPLPPVNDLAAAAKEDILATKDDVVSRIEEEVDHAQEAVADHVQEAADHAQEAADHAQQAVEDAKEEVTSELANALSPPQEVVDSPVRATPDAAAAVPGGDLDTAAPEAQEAGSMPRPAIAVRNTEQDPEQEEEETLGEDVSIG